MKRVLFLMITVALATALGMAQAAQPAAGQAPAAAKPAASGVHQPQTKTAEEFKAYQDASSKTTGAEAEAAAADFVGKFPDSEVKGLVYLRAMRNYQNEDNADKTVEMGRKILSVDKDNGEALVTVSGVLAQRTRETDLDRDDRLAEAARDAEHALQVAEGDLPIPATTPKEQVEAYRNAIRTMAYDAMGTVGLAKKDYPAAETNYRKATEYGKTQPDPITWLRLSIALDNQKKYTEALDAATKAVQYAPEGSSVSMMAKSERDRLAKLTAAAPAPPKPETPKQ